MVVSNCFNPISNTYAFATGQTIVTYTATDAANNATSCSFTVTVSDNEPPVPTCPPNVTLQCMPSGLDNVPATDNCASYVQITFLGQTSTPGACPQAYTLTRTWRAQDECGNSVTASQVITVVDTQAPNFNNAPPNITVACAHVPGVPANPQATDNCGPTTVSYQGQTESPGNCASGYVITRTWHATDQCGNVKTHVQTITVQGNSYGEPEPDALDRSRPMETRMTQINYPEEKSAENRVQSASSAFPSASFALQPNPTTDRIWLDLTDFAGVAVTVS